MAVLKGAERSNKLFPLTVGSAAFAE